LLNEGTSAGCEPCRENTRRFLVDRGRHLNRGRACTIPAAPRTPSCPDPQEVAQLVTARTRPSSSSIQQSHRSGLSARGSGSARATAERRGLIVFSDEIYDQILMTAPSSCPWRPGARYAVRDTLRPVQVYRACGYRVGWACSPDAPMRGRISERPGAARIAAPVQQRAAQLGGARRARGATEHS